MLRSGAEIRGLAVTFLGQSRRSLHLMRSTLIAGLLVTMPTAVLLAVAALALLVSNLRCRLRRALDRRFHGHGTTTRPELPLADQPAREQVHSDAQPLDSVSALPRQ